MNHKQAAYIVYALIALSFFAAGCLITFFAGYQLALYQEANNDTLLPHFNVSGPSDPSCNSDDLGCCEDRICEGIDKPVIYLYPTHTEKINVKLAFPAGFSITTPVYNDAYGWNVSAQPDGTLTNLSDGKTYPYLYWEGNPTAFSFNMHEGFVVAGNQTTTFLNKELTVLGLNQSEKSAFVSYWSPKLQANKYTLIHFAGNEYTSVVKLSITPAPNALLRVFMVEQPLSSPIKVTPQSFPTFHRSGFTAVEWGGTVLPAQ
jgi:hypothetical protein